MNKYIIKKYVSKLCLDDVKNFIIKNNIDATDNEVKIIYNYIKNDWYELIYGDYNSIFIKIKPYLSNENYQNMINLYNEYKEKYKSYL